MRRSLALLAISGLLPIVALSAAFGTITLRGERRAVEDQAHAHAQFAATLIAARLAEDTRAVHMISQIPALDAGIETSRFDILSERVIADEPSWLSISIIDPQGNRIDDIPKPIGGVSHGRVLDGESLRRAVVSQKPAIGSVITRPDGILSFAVRAPVVRAGQTRYVVSAVIPAASLNDLVRFEAMPSDWRAGLVDENGYVVASSETRSPGLGHLASGAALIARMTGVQGVYHFTRRDGTKAAAVFVPVGDTGWTVHVSAPDRFYSGPARQAILLIIGSTLLCLLLFALLARLMFGEMRLSRGREAAALQSQRMEALGLLTGGVAHDFNNLLTPIIGGLDMLRRRVADDPKSLRHVDLAMTSAERARTLVGRLLAFSRRQTLAPRDIDIATLIAGLSELVDLSMTPMVEVKIEIPGDLPPARADPAQLELAILNLAINARDAMPDGGTITIAAALVPPGANRDLPPGRHIAISVADTGTGMDEATMKQAVDPFFTTKAADKGTGLGLSMAHGFAAQSGGALRLASAPGAGTIVTIVLPEGMAAPIEAKPATIPSINARGRVLLVDDDETVRASTAEMLQQGGHDVTEAASVDQALSVLETDRGIDAVVTDYLMPERSGADLIRALRIDRPGMPVLLITGYINVSGDVPDDVPKLSKPFRADDLLGGLALLMSGANG